MASNASQLRAALARAAVDDQIVGPLGDLGIEIVHQHPQRGFLWPSLARQRRAAGRADDERAVVITMKWLRREGAARCEDEKIRTCARALSN